MRPQPERVGPGQTSVWGFLHPVIVDCTAQGMIEHDGLSSPTRARAFGRSRPAISQAITFRSQISGRDSLGQGSPRHSPKTVCRWRASKKAESNF